MYVSGVECTYQQTKMVANKLIIKYRKKLEKLREKNSYFEWETKTEKILQEMIEEHDQKNSKICKSI